MEKKFYITTAIAYVNAQPHMGHVLEFVQADMIARYHRLLGENVYFLTGTDENSLKSVRAAEQEGIGVKELVERNAETFRRLKPLLNLSYTDFIRTTEKRHIEGAQKLWRACRKEDLYRKTYQGLYCVGCEKFYSEKELANGLCPEHKTKPEPVEEENYFFRLSNYQAQLKELISSNAYLIVPTGRRQEVLSFIDSGLEDFSVSRSQKRAGGWGVPVPEDPSQVMYVWFDALANYITALGYAWDDPLFYEWWQSTDHILHVIGKDIIRFHALYWPAMLLSAGLRLPRALFVHGFVTVGGEKMSKSLGNVVDPFALVEKYGTDPVRYYLLREVPATEDGDFTYEKLQARYNADLANNLGNLLNRSVTMVERYRNGVVRRVLSENDTKSLRPLASGVVQAYAEAMQRYELHAATAVIWKLIDATNLYIQNKRPWDLYKDAAKARELDRVLYEVSEALRIATILLQPVVPETAVKIWKQLGIKDRLEGQTIQAAKTWGLLADHTKVEKGDIIFPRLT